MSLNTITCFSLSIVPQMHGLKEKESQNSQVIDSGKDPWKYLRLIRVKNSVINKITNIHVHKQLSCVYTADTLCIPDPQDLHLGRYIY